MKEHDKGPPILKTSLSVGQLQGTLARSIKNGYVNDNDIILWVGEVEEGSRYQTEMGCAPGSIIFGIQHIDNTFGILRVEPSAVSEYLC